MITELKDTIDRADSVCVILAKGKAEGQYTATLVVNSATLEVPTLQVVGAIDELDDAVSQAFNEGSEVFTEAHDSIASFKAAADAAKEKAKPAPAAKKSAVKKTAVKKAVANKPAPTPPAEDANGTFDIEMDDATAQKMKDLGVNLDD